jgi:hypothetical protein
MRHRVLVVRLLAAAAARGGAEARIPVPNSGAQPASSRAALLQVARDGGARVVYVRGAELRVGRATSSGAWRTAAALRLPASGYALDGFVLDRAGREVVLLRLPDGTRLTLARRLASGWRLYELLGDRRSAGPSGVVVDRDGLPAVAYTLRAASSDTTLRLARFRRDGGIDTQELTSGGFPRSDIAPAAAPVVLPNGRVDVVQMYGYRGFVAAVQWSNAEGGWLGQFLYAATQSMPVGRLSAVAGADGTVYSAWSTWMTDMPVAVLATHRNGGTTTTLRRRVVLAGLGVGSDGPQLAVNRAADGGVAGLRVGRSGELVAAAGAVPVEARVADLVVAPGGARWLLLEGRNGLEARRM